MNCRYFACADCKEYIDAGYRWAYWQLEHPSVVRLEEHVTVSAVLAADEYWSPPLEEQSDWLTRQILPSVRRFFVEHEGHKVLYLEEEHFCGDYVAYQGYSEVPTNGCA